MKATYPLFCKQLLISVLYTILKPCGAWGEAVLHWPPRFKRTSMGTLFPNWLLRIECSILQGRQPCNLSPIPSHCDRETGFLQQVRQAIVTKQDHPGPPGRHGQLRSYFLKDRVWKSGNQARNLYSARTKRKGRLSLLWPSVSPVVRRVRPNVLRSPTLPNPTFPPKSGSLWVIGRWMDPFSTYHQGLGQLKSRKSKVCFAWCCSESLKHLFRPPLSHLTGTCW